MGMIHRRFIAKNKQANKLRKEPNALKPIARDQSKDIIICRCEKITVVERSTACLYVAEFSAFQLPCAAQVPCFVESTER